LRFERGKQPAIGTKERRLLREQGGAAAEVAAASVNAMSALQVEIRSDLGINYIENKNALPLTESRELVKG
jgi:hypothetical protein